MSRTLHLEPPLLLLEPQDGPVRLALPRGLGRPVRVRARAAARVDVARAAPLVLGRLLRAEPRDEIAGEAQLARARPRSAELHVLDFGRAAQLGLERERALHDEALDGARRRRRRRRHLL